MKLELDFEVGLRLELEVEENAQMLRNETLVEWLELDSEMASSLALEVEEEIQSNQSCIHDSNLEE